jgi:hypothetical protein
MLSGHRNPAVGRRRNAATARRPEEPAVAGHPPDDPPQRLLGGQVAVQLPEVKEDRRLEQGILLRLLDPAGEPVLPHAQWRPPAGLVTITSPGR